MCVYINKYMRTVQWFVDICTKNKPSVIQGSGTQSFANHRNQNSWNLNFHPQLDSILVHQLEKHGKAISFNFFKLLVCECRLFHGLRSIWLDSLGPSLPSLSTAYHRALSTAN